MSMNLSLSGRTADNYPISANIVQTPTAFSESCRPFLDDAERVLQAYIAWLHENPFFDEEQLAELAEDARRHVALGCRWRIE